MCAGYGGIGLGLKNIFGERMRTLAYCELEGFAQANLISKMEAGLMDVAPLWNDLKTFPYGSFHGLVDILIAGYPCQPFSAAGKRLGTEDPRHLWPFIARGIRLLRPKLCFFENVEGHISLGLREVIGELEQMGYKVSWGIFSAREVGAPHQRKRVFIMAVSNSLGGAAGLSRSLAWNERFAGVADNGGSEGCGELADASCFGSEGAELQSEGLEQFRQAWPSRPGEPQHGWEPPRVVGSVPAKLANFCSRDAQQGGNPAQTSGEGFGAWGEGADAMPNGGSSVCRGDTGDESQARVVANSIGIHEYKCSGRESEQFESWDASEAMGNADHGRLASGIDAGSGTEADRGGQSDIEQAEPRQAQPQMGGDTDGSADRMDYAELCVSCDNRTDELRLLGNGVVPATAERAFRTLWEELQ